METGNLYHSRYQKPDSAFDGTHCAEADYHIQKIIDIE